MNDIEVTDYFSWLFTKK